MNIGIDIRALTAPYRTGVGELITELLTALFNIDNQNQYFLFYNSYGEVSDKIPKWNQNNVRYIVTKIPNKLLNAGMRFFKYPKLDRLIVKHCIYGACPVSTLDYFFSPNPNYTALSKNTKHILLIHDLTLDIFPQFFTPRARLWHSLINPERQCAKANIILTPSENTKRDVANYYHIDPNKITVLHPGLSQIFLNYLNLRDEEQKVEGRAIKNKYHLPEKFILFLGAIEPRKNIIGLIKAFEIAVETHGNASLHLILAGAPGWKNKAIYERANKSPYRDRIKFLGFVDPEDRPLLYAAADLFVFPSFYEGFGLPVLEAMACGAPVITSNRSSIPEITGSNAYLINPNKPAEIAEGIFNLLGKDKKNYAPTTDTISKFSWAEAAKKFLEILKNQG